MRNSPRKRITTVLAAFAAAGLATQSASAIDWDDERAARAMQRLDIDESGGITVEEYRAGAKSGQRDRVEANFRHIDADGDGVISARELRAQWATANNVLRDDVWEHGDPAQARIEAAAFAELDDDGDGYLSLAEFGAGAKAGDKGQAGHEFERIDDDGDGRLSRNEFHEDWSRFRNVLAADVLLAPQQAPLALSETERQELAFEALDTDGDGVVDLREYRSGLDPRGRGGAAVSFGRLDDNNDGTLSRAELYEEWASVAGRLRTDLYDADHVLAIERRGGAGVSLDRAFDAMDRDDNGRLTASEFQAGVVGSARETGRQFSHLDANEDGFVDRTEFDRGLRVIRLRGAQVESAGTTIEGEAEVEIED